MRRLQKGTALEGADCIKIASGDLVPTHCTPEHLQLAITYKQTMKQAIAGKMWNGVASTKISQLSHV